MQCRRYPIRLRLSKKKGRTIARPSRECFCSRVDGLIASAATATTTATVATSAAATTTAAAASAATPAATIFARPSLVDRQWATLMVLFIEPLNGCLSFCVGTHFHKPESFAAPGFAILNNLRALDCAERTEQLLQIGATHGIREIPDIQLLTHGTDSCTRRNTTQSLLSGSPIERGPRGTQDGRRKRLLNADSA